MYNIVFQSSCYNGNNSINNNVQTVKQQCAFRGERSVLQVYYNNNNIAYSRARARAGRECVGTRTARVRAPPPPPRVQYYNNIHTRLRDRVRTRDRRVRVRVRVRERVRARVYGPIILLLYIIIQVGTVSRRQVYRYHTRACARRVGVGS